jgi:hypothetical protein
MVDWNQNHLRRGSGVFLLMIPAITRGSAQVEMFTVNPEQSEVVYPPLHHGETCPSHASA